VSATDHEVPAAAVAIVASIAGVVELVVEEVAAARGPPQKERWTWRANDAGGAAPAIGAIGEAAAAVGGRRVQHGAAATLPEEREMIEGAHSGVVSAVMICRALRGGGHETRQRDVGPVAGVVGGG
jgi:hypothetical protein